MGAGAMGQPAAGGKGQPGGQQPGGQPPAAGGKGQIGGGGQSPAPGGKGQPGSPGMNPQMAGPIINNPSMGGSQQPQMPITQLMQQFNQAQAMGGQQPGAQPPAAGGKGQPGGQQQGSLPSYAQSYYQQVMGGQPQMGGQQPQVGAQADSYRQQMLQAAQSQDPLLRGAGNAYLTGGQSAFDQYRNQAQQQMAQQGMGGQLPSITGAQQAMMDAYGGQQPMTQPPVGGQQQPSFDIMQEQQAIRQAMQNPQLKPITQQETEQRYAEFLRQRQQAPAGTMAWLGPIPAGGQQPMTQPPVGPQGGVQQPRMDLNSMLTEQRRLQDQVRGTKTGSPENRAAAQQLSALATRWQAQQRGPQPNNPLARPQQVRPEDPRMQAMRGIQQIVRGGPQQMDPAQFEMMRKTGMI